MAKAIKVTVSNPNNAEIPNYLDTLLALNGQQATRGKFGTAYLVEQELNFIVCELRTFQGNSNSYEGWLYNPANALNITIKW